MSMRKRWSHSSMRTAGSTTTSPSTKLSHDRSSGADTVACRLCATLVAREATVCPSCGTKDPWIPDEPSINPRVIRLAMWGGGIVLVGLLLVVAGLMMFGPRAERDERDHRPPGTASEAHDSR